jgi:hypothetical protein
MRCAWNDSKLNQLPLKLALIMEDNLVMQLLLHVINFVGLLDSRLL